MENVLTVVEQKEVTFYDDELLAVLAKDGHIYVSVRHMCEALGLARQGQVRRIRDHDVLSEGYKGGNVLLPPSPDGRGGGRQQVGLLRADLVPLWLSGVRVKVVKEEIRPKLKQFQKEAAKVLWEAFQEGRLTLDHDLEALALQDTPEAQAYQMAQAVLQLARSQLMMRAQLETHTQRLDDYEGRLELVESQLAAPAHAISQSQAMQISQAVKAVAIEVSKQSKKNEFGAIYGELYRRFEITSYKLLPASRFDEAMEWLTDWYSSVTGSDDVPF